MSLPVPDDSSAASAVNERATTIRYRIVAISIAMAFMLYLDRVCLGEIIKTESFLSDFSGSTKEEIGEVLGAFFFTYALFQVPAGWASDRFGGRITLSFFIVAWSVLTLWTGWVASLSGLLVMRLAFGVAQAGAYPTASGVIRQWFDFRGRAMASSFVSLGGRLGGTLAPLISTALIVSLGMSWRSVLTAYGLVGLIVALGYFLVVRDRPSEHRRVNAAERELIGIPHDSKRTDIKDVAPLIWACCKSPSLWLNSFAQFCINVGWAFLITWLPTYLVEEKNVDPLVGAKMVTGVLAIAIVGQLIGGVVSGRAVRRFGLRWGRILPLCCTNLIAGTAYLTCLGLDSVWPIVICCGIVSLMTDVGNPCIWAFMQDVGGRNTSAVFGWANMWGNFGAASSAIVLPRLQTLGEQTGQGNTLVFLVLGGAYFAAALAVLGMNATKPIQPPKEA